MYLPDMFSVLPRRSMAPPTMELDKSHFSLDTSGVAGVFGGDEAVSAMATVHVYENRRWLGWYNSPGSYQIAKRYGLLAKSRFFDGFFPGVHADPAILFDVDDLKGPTFRAAHSGTILEETGHLAALVMKECAAREGTVVKGRRTRPVGVTVVELNHAPPSETFPKPTRASAHTPLLAAIPIGVSVGTCVTCAVFQDWYSFSLILMGIITNGIACLVIGSGRLMFTHPESANGSPAGDGILSSTNDVVVLKGAEGAVNAVTHGRFSLHFPSESQYKNIGWCSILFTIQFIVAQLLLIPQGSLFGQIMVVASLGVACVYNAWLSSLDKGRIQLEILLNDVLKKPAVTTYRLGTREAMAVFVLLVLRPEDPNHILNGLVPDDTKVWKQWKAAIVRRLLNKEKLEFVEADWALDEFDQQERTLLGNLHGDAQAAYSGYVRYATAK